MQYAPSVIAVGDASSPIGGAFVAVTSSAVPSGEGGTPQGVTEGALQQQLNYAMIEFGDGNDVSLIQIERFTDESGICSITDKEGYSYILKVNQDILEETNRVNKPKRIFNISPDFKFTSVSKIDTKNKDYKCIMIGKNSTSQISMQNIRNSDIDKIPKKVPVSIVGMLSYKL